jgi:hypothetical protein
MTGRRNSRLKKRAEETPTSNTRNSWMFDSLTAFDWSIMADVDSDRAVNTLFMQLEVMN